MQRNNTRNQLRNIILLGSAILTLFTMTPSFAVEHTRGLATDHRIKVVSFQDNNVVPINASIFTTTQVVFGQGEVIENIQNGDVDAWTVSVQKGLPNMLFLKPTLVGSNTNMTVVTNQHTYYFQLQSISNGGRNKNKATYAIHFTYPLEVQAKLKAQLDFNRQEKQAILNAKQNPKAYNWDYSFSGSRSIMPLHVFDDGRFTYMQLQPNQPLPAVFAVDNAKGQESVVNFRREGQYLVIQQVAPQFTLRDGTSHVASLFNNRIIHQIKVRGEG